jgi:cysteinyl-tRNA synthetase
MFEDLLKRHLTFRGYKVHHVMNLTDVEDKIIAAAQENNSSIVEYTKPYIQAFFDDLDALNIQHADEYPKATEHIEEIVGMIQTLKDKGHTYDRDGSTYFKISTFEPYGKLSGVQLDEVISGARVDSDEYEKEDARDFVLWKAKKEGEHSWDTPLGDGRPGWHIECSAMAVKYLGEHFDLHCGGEDLIFPHHENEIAQSEACTCKTFVNYWMHCRHLMVEGEKMSKSKGNFYTLRDLLEKGNHPMAVRYFLISGHYRSPLNLSTDSLQAAHAAWSRIMDFRNRLRELVNANADGETVEPLATALSDVQTKFVSFMDDDLDSPRSLAAIFDFIRDANKLLDDNKVPSSQAQTVLDALDQIDQVLGVMQEDDAMLDEEIDNLIEERQQARKDKNFARADQIRDELAAQGIILEDTKDGVRWKRR